MNLDSYVDTVRNGVTNAAALADEQTQSIAARLGATIDSSARLALIEALSDAAGVISADLAPGSVELRMAGADPQFVVTAAPLSGEPTMLLPDQEQDDMPTESFPESTEDEPVARISLRLPASVKTRVDELADEAGISTNAWLVRAITNAIESPRDGVPQPPNAPRPPDFGGIFGPNGPFGQHGVFGPSGPFGDRRGRQQRDDVRRMAREQGWKSAHGVQGWVK
ncbi:hypothetical protein [Microlunatus ginsengisoli]|uniref:Uncharacterized protein n=1 Tax=Microlunatus ginsengisoli TaxID=363863 RepID=A0ABP7API6_9ACTN